MLEDFNIKINSDSASASRVDLDHERQRVIAWQVNNYTRPLEWLIDEDAMVEFIQTTSPTGLRIYQRSLDFLFIIACEIALDDPKRLAWQEKKIPRAVLHHSIGEGHYWEFEGTVLNQEQVDNIRAVMRRLVEQDLPITREILTIDKAKRIFLSQGEHEMTGLFFRANLDPVEVYKCAGRYGYFWQRYGSVNWHT